jgi:nitroreductase
MTPISTSQILDSLNWRYATKVFDATKTIPAETWSALEESLILTPSSFGLQPWKFLIITDKALREQLVEHSWNQRQVADCSHLVVMLAKKNMLEADVDKLLHRIVEVRGGTADALAGYKGMMMGSIGAAPPEYVTQWSKNQAYIALGQLMGAAEPAGVPDADSATLPFPDGEDEALQAPQGLAAEAVDPPAASDSPPPSLPHPNQAPL